MKAFHATVPLVLFASLMGCASNSAMESGSAQGQVSSAPQAAADAPPTYGWETFRPASDPNVLLAGMPSQEALDVFKARGGTTVINLRTEDEMAAFPGYRESIEARGLKYVHVPTRGSEMGEAMYTPVASAIDSASGPVLLHCGSGGRATYAYAMHRMEHEGLSADQAAAWCTATRGKPWETGDEKLKEFAARPGAD